MITVHDKYDGRQDFVHALAIAHQRIDARIAEQNVGHDLLDVGAPEKFDARYGADHILSDDRAQFLITKVLIPDAAVRLGQWIVLGGRPRVDVELPEQLCVASEQRIRF